MNTSGATSARHRQPQSIVHALPTGTAQRLQHDVLELLRATDHVLEVGFAQTLVVFEPRPDEQRCDSRMAAPVDTRRDNRARELSLPASLRGRLLRDRVFRSEHPQPAARRGKAIRTHAGEMSVSDRVPLYNFVPQQIHCRLVQLGSQHVPFVGAGDVANRDFDAAHHGHDIDAWRA